MCSGHDDNYDLDGTARGVSLLRGLMISGVRGSTSLRANCPAKSH
jgi:hypothetical protein